MADTSTLKETDFAHAASSITNAHNAGYLTPFQSKHLKEFVARVQQEAAALPVRTPCADCFFAKPSETSDELLCSHYNNQTIPLDFQARGCEKFDDLPF